MSARLRLGVNIDHVATLRQARYAALSYSRNTEPDVVAAALEAEAGGADSLTIHVRGDHRHMQPEDGRRLRERIRTQLNLEMGLTAQMMDYALELKPDFVCLVPESRQEITTEGGLDVKTHLQETAEAVRRLQDAGILVSLFIDPDMDQVLAAATTGARMIELHTGAFSNAEGEVFEWELEKLREAAHAGEDAGLQVNAGHGINYRNIYEIFVVPHLAELNIGHSIISRAVFVGLRQAVADMRHAMDSYPAESVGPMAELQLP
ncbi:MAG: pyridoxine 5'-phosphate synthase [Verrucomicrobiota bacterium]